MVLGVSTRWHEFCQHFRVIKLVLTLIAAVGCSQQMARAATDTLPLISGYAASGAARTNYGGSLGVQFKFNGATGSEVTDLGMYDGGQSSGLKTNHLVTLYAITDRLATTGTVLASVTINAGAKSRVDTNGYIYSALVSPVPLTNGAFYVVAADYPLTNSADPYLNLSPGTIQSAVASDFVSRFSDSGGFVPHHDFPNTLNTPLAGYAGPTLRVAGLPAPPVFTASPASATAYVRHTVSFQVSVQGAVGLQWQFAPAGQSFTNLAGSSRYTGVNSTVLTVSNLSGSDAGNFRVVATNSFGSSTSDPASLLVLNGSGTILTNDFFAQKILSNSPVAYWRLNDAPSDPLIYDYAGFHDATNDNAALGVAGMRAPAFPGFNSSNTAAYFDGFSSSIVSSPGLLNSLSSFTLLGWFNPSGPNTDLRTGLFGQDDALELGFNDSDGVNLWTPNGDNWTQLTTGTNGFGWNHWYFVTVTADGSGVKLYVDGTLRAQTGALWTGSSAARFKIGGGGIFDAAGNYFNGEIEDVAILPAPLTAVEIQQLYGTALGANPPAILHQPPADFTVLENQTAAISVEAAGTDLVYQWQHAGSNGSYTNLVESDAVRGVNSATLHIFASEPGGAGSYRVQIANQLNQVTSDGSELIVLPRPAPGTYGAAVLSLVPFAYWRLDETNDPAAGNVIAYDYAGQHHAAYGTGVQNSRSTGVAGPRPETGFTHFDTNNGAVKLTPGTQESWLTVPPLNLNTNSITVCAWVKPAATNFTDFTSIFFSRSPNTLVGLNFGGTAGQNNDMLTYTWTDSYYTWAWQTYAYLTNTDWAFVAFTVNPVYGEIYINAQPLRINVWPHPIQEFEGESTIGTDLQDPLNRTFNGLIDEVAVFNRALSQQELENVYNARPLAAPSLSLVTTSGIPVLTWSTNTPARLQSTTVLEGARTIWAPENLSSPLPLTNSQGLKFYRLATP